MQNLARLLEHTQSWILTTFSGVDWVAAFWQPSIL